MGASHHRRRGHRRRGGRRGERGGDPGGEAGELLALARQTQLGQLTHGKHAQRLGNLGQVGRGAVGASGPRAARSVLRVGQYVGADGLAHAGEQLHAEHLLVVDVHLGLGGGREGVSDFVFFPHFNIFNCTDFQFLFLASVYVLNSR